MSSFHFPPLGEFNFIQKILEGDLAMDEIPPQKRVWFGAGDDCAAFDGWLVTKDMSAENSHFRLDWSSPADAERIAKAFSDGFQKRGIALIGGDIVSSNEGLFSITMLGRAAGEPLRRSGAKVGDTVYVSSPIGASGAGLWAFLHGKNQDAEITDVVREHLAPVIDEHRGEKLLALGVSGGCIDLSDGLSSELNHLALSSGVKIQIEEAKIPVHPGALRLSKKYGVDPREFWLFGGEDYRLLFTSTISEETFRKNGVPAYAIGKVFEGSGVEMLNLQGKMETVKASGWSHL